MNSHLEVWLTLQEGLWATFFKGSFWNCRNLFHKASNIHKKKDEQDEIIRGVFERLDQSRLAIKSFTIELVSNAYAQLSPDNTLSSFTKFLPEQLNLEGQWEVEVLEISYPSMYQNVTEGKFKKLLKSSEFYSLEPSLYPSFTDIVEAMNTLIQQRHNHSVSKSAKSWNLPCKWRIWSCILQYRSETLFRR